MAEAQRDEIAKLEALYAANPEGRVFTHLAEAYRKAGELERAREILAAGIARHPDSATAYVVLGRVAYDSGSQEDARGAFERALALDGGNLVAHRYLGELALAAGDRGAALRHYGELLARNPSDESLQQQVRELGTPEPAPAEPELPALAAEAQEELEQVPAPGIEPEAAAEGAEYPSGGDDFDAAALPGDLGALAGGQPWEPAAGDADESFDFSIDQIPGDFDVEPLPTLELEALDASAGLGGDAGTSAEPWSWAEPGDSMDLDSIQPLEALEPLPEVGAPDEAPGFTTFEPLPELDLPEDAVPADFALEPDVEAGAGMAGSEGAGFEVEATAGDEPLDPASFDAPPGEPSFEPEPALADAAAEEGVLTEGSFEEAGSAFDTSLPEDFELADEFYEDGAPDTGAVLPPLEPESAEEDAAGVAAGEAVEGSGQDVVTETMAELYRSQGFHDRAAEVYRSLLRQYPGDERLQARLAEVEAETGEVWLGDVESAFTGAAGATSGQTTPYAWDSGADEPLPPGPGISDYFSSLLRWRPAAAGAVEPESAPAEAFEPAAETAPQPWESASLPEAPAQEKPAELLLDEPAADTPELVLEDAAVEDEDVFTGWTPDFLLEPEPPSGGNAVAGVPDPSNLMPWEVPEPPVLATPADEPAAPPVAPEPPRELAAQDAAEEDEDLEMFRSWLQSLKK